MNLKINEKEALIELRDILQQKYPISDIKLFGSKAKGVDNKESDLDVLIITDKMNWAIEKNLYEICFEISLKYDVLISPIIFTEEEVKNRFIKATPFYQNVEREGISIWKKNF